ncbi:F-box protein FBW2-like [Euphorbia lathyris]|uniref:F-box protein FBW2-like n=1 Tax=Euphorbia lathyris TaxID=212925 RepID=UPI003314030A
MANLGVQKENNVKMSKRSSSSSTRWEDLNPDILAFILVRISIEERVGLVSLVCKNWLACVSGPYCWSEINIQDWCQKQDRSIEDVDRVAIKLMKCNRGSFGLLSATKLGNRGFLYAANWGTNLKVLKIPMSEVTDKMVERHTNSLVNLSVLDISFCLNITSKGIAEFGNNCKALIDLRRNWRYAIFKKVDNSEAMAIANTMSGLKKLEMCCGSFTKLGLQAILTNCTGLSQLNIEGCWNVILKADVFDKCVNHEFFYDPLVDAYSDEDDDDEFTTDDEDNDEEFTTDGEDDDEEFTTDHEDDDQEFTDSE